ncbi:MAG: DUF4268 domain-containing protein [Candidatus Omnitrophica bacterium]|nr:DUF4268 domain-containing protein [Candidatus Omnitrophota bacterium]
MAHAKQIYLTYWRELKLFIDDRGLDWTFSSFEGENEAVVKIGSPGCKICLSLIGADTKNPKNLIMASFWIPDSKELFERLKANRIKVEAEMGKALVWDSQPGRKSCWVRIKSVMDLSDPKNWPLSFEWFAENAQKIRDICHRFSDALPLQKTGTMRRF